MRPLLDYRPALTLGEGIGRYTREVARALCLRADVSVRLFGPTWTRASFEPSEQGVDSAALFRLRVPSRALTAALRWSPLRVEHLFRGGADVVHHTQYRRLPSRLPEVATIHDLVYLDSDAFVSNQTAQRMSAFAREAARHCAAIVTPSHAVADEVSDRLGLPRERVFGAPLGVDHVHALPRSHEAAQAIADEVARAGPYLFTAARIEHRKNHLAVLRALESLGATAPRWVVAGPDGEGAEAFHDALRRSPVRGRVTVLGRIAEAALRERIGGALAFVLVPQAEGFGLAPLEAMALGRPAITSDVAVVREVCGGGATLVSPGDTGELTTAIEEALELVASGADAVRRAGEAAADHARAFTWERCAADHLRAYAYALESRL